MVWTSMIYILHQSSRQSLCQIVLPSDLKLIARGALAVSFNGSIKSKISVIISRFARLSDDYPDYVGTVDNCNCMGIFKCST